MIFAVDTAIVLDVLTNDARHALESVHLLQQARERGALIMCPIVWAEVHSFAHDGAPLREALLASGIQFDPLDESCSTLAGRLWHEYRRNGGKRTRLVPDFLIGAHALTRKATLLTRDRGFYRQYFHGLTVLSSEKA